LTDDLPPRPKPLPVNFELAPTDLCDLNQWVLWRYEWKEGKDGKPGKWDKPPYTSQGRHASATNPGTWISFKEAKTAYQRGQELPADNKKHFDGIGFVPTKDVSTELHPTLIDLDKCRDPDTGEIEAWAKEELDLINSYSEVSPSATGIRIVTRARALPEDGKGRKKGPVEIYQTAHYLTITGHRLEQFPRTVEERVDEVDCFYRRHFHETNGKGKKPGDQRSSERTNLTDDDIITLATKAANGDKFMRLMDGDISGYKSESEADEALCCIIAFYTRDEAQIEQIWGQSGLARRDKFQREDYRQRTIENALKTVKEQYKGTGFEAKKRKNKGNAKRSIATRLVELAKESGSELWHTPDGEPFISFTIEDHRENYPLRNKAVRRWLGKLIYEAEGKAANAQALQDATNILEAEAVYKGHEYDVHVRVGEYGDAIYIDLCDNKWRAIEINASGWKITEHPPIRFMRSKGMLALPDPVGGGSLEDLKHLLNINDERTWILIKAILVGALLPSAPCPVVIFGGEQGSSKSTTQRIIKDLIDPNEAPLRLPPKDERDLMIAAKNSWIVSFDNLSGIRNDLSDALCVLCTGGAFSTRELYTDTEETLLSVRRPVFLNGIDSIPSRHDLLDRAIIIILPRMKEGQRRTEKEIMAEFDRIRPGVLGALCSAVSIGLKNLPTTIIQNMPRMADFAIWVTACEPGLGLKRP
jgi:primase-polymerase (primpol)-like protein